MQNTLDCRGLACPEPVVQARRYITDNAFDAFTIIVDNQASRENVTRFLKSQGYAIEEQQANGVWSLTARIDSELAHSTAPSAVTPSLRETSGKTLVFIASAMLGNGDNNLGSRLMHTFLKTLPEIGDSLWRIVFVNGGVTLTTTDSLVIESLVQLEQQGISLLVCGACLEHFGILRQKAVGQTTNMLDIVTSIQLADKIIRV